MTTKDTLIAGVRKSLAALNIQRESLEQESAGIVSELTAVNPANPNAPPMGIDTPLTDREGYPRNDIDVYRARTLRGRLAEIQTDHKKLMKEIEAQLQQLASLQNANKQQEEKEEYAARMQTKPKPKYDPVTGKWVVRNWDGSISGGGGGKDDSKRSFDNLLATPPSDTTATEAAVANMNIEATIHRAAESSMPFVKVNSVAPNSPAASAGLQANDLILAFGPITISSMNEIADLVRTAAAAYEIIELRIQRSSNNNDNTTTTTSRLLRLQPRPWNGRGLLGCHIVPV